MVSSRTGGYSFGSQPAPGPMRKVNTGAERVERLTPMPGGAPLPQAESAKGTHGQVSTGVSMGAVLGGASGVQGLKAPPSATSGVTAASTGSASAARPISAASRYFCGSPS